MAERINLETEFYIFRKQGEFNRNHRVIISSHGGQRAEHQGYMGVAGVNFFQSKEFGGAARGTLEQWFARIGDRYLLPQAEIPGDYVLSKFQGRHGGNNESYESIMNFVDNHDTDVITIRNRIRFRRRDLYLSDVMESLQRLPGRNPYNEIIMAYCLGR